MKIRFKKLAATSTFIKLFGADGNKPDTSASKTDETDEVYEYYYKRGNTYYFRNDQGNKISINYNEPQPELIKGNKYKMDAISS